MSTGTKVVVKPKKIVVKATIEATNLNNSENSSKSIASGKDLSSLSKPDVESNLSYLGGAIEDNYQNKELREHIYSDPDTYAGSIAPSTEQMWCYDDETDRMVQHQITFIECFYKLFDEILVNALDQRVRLAQKQKDHPGLKGVKSLYIDTDIETGVISVKNDGEGVDVVKHAKFGKYVPEMIFGNLLTSANYDKTKDTIVGGKNGYGAKITNIYSKKFSIETVDSARKLLYKQTWKENMTICEDPIIEKWTKAPYTKITYLPDYARFDIANPAVIGDWHLIHKRAYDASACMGAGVSVHLNGKKIAVKNFEEYINLYIGKKSETKRAYIEVNDRWQLGVCLSNGSAQQVSFVNGICTDRGGRHVKNIMDNLSKKIIESITEAQKKKGIIVKPDYIKKNLFLFLKSTISRPNFDTQTKRQLTTLVSKFGSRCELPDEFVAKVIKLGVLDRAKKLAEFRERENLDKKTNGKPRAARVVHEKLHDASEAGKKLHHKCTIVFTEGDSAATFMATGLNGIPLAERRFWGWFPLKGKILNTRSATLKQLEDNDEIKMIKQIIGLETGKTYKDVKELKLRYGRVMFLTDADKDGFHIKGLGFNYFQQNFPELLKREGFICDFATPINKAIRVNGSGDPIKNVPVVEFYSELDFAEWCKANNGGKGWSVQYYKGLGTYEAPEARALCSNMRITHYTWNDEQIEVHGKTADTSSHKFDLAFAKMSTAKTKFSDDRKVWVSNDVVMQSITPLQDQVNIVTYDYFIDNNLKQFAIADNVRSIPYLYDGLKPSQRKVLYSAFKRKLIQKLKVAQLAGYVAEHAAYHHGEASLYGAIIHMAQDYVGSNNVNLLYPSGGFGTRIGGKGPKFKKGDDHASPRYIFTYLNPITNALFNHDDFPLLETQMEEDQEIEPLYYIPTLPLILINGASGIGTGYSTEIPGYNPTDVVNNVKAHLKGEEMAEMIPWYRGYRGRIIKTGPNSYITVGEYSRDPHNRNKIRIEELPVGHKNCRSFSGYTEFLNSLLDDEVAKSHGLKRKKKTKGKNDDDDDDDSTKSSSFKESVIMDYEIINGTDTAFVVDIIFKDGVLDKELANNTEYRFEKKLKLAYSYKIQNMHLYVEGGGIKKFDDPRDIIEEFCRVRRPQYVKRRERLLRKYQHGIDKAEAKYRFVTETINNTIDIRRKKRTVVDELLANCEPPYPKYTTNVDDEEDKAGYNYLLSMQMSSVTVEMLEKLQKDIAKATQQRADTEGKTEVDIWEEDLSNFTTEYDKATDAWHKYHKLTPVVPRKKITINKTKHIISAKPRILTVTPSKPSKPSKDTTASISIKKAK
jgi:DNA topoisomerase-2